MKRFFVDIYRGSSVFATAEIFGDTVYTAAINGPEKINARMVSDTAILVAFADYINFRGFKYQINKFVDVSIDHRYTYTAELKATAYDLLKKGFVNASGQSIFSITGTAHQILTQLVGYMNTVDNNWTVGTVEDDGAVKTIEFINDDCRSALGRIFNAYNLEVQYVVKQINLLKKYVTDDEILHLAYGEGNGLYKLTKRTEGELFTRVRAFGSTRNIPANYRGGLERLSFTPGYVDIADAASYGTPIERIIEFNDVFPHRNGTITGIGSDFLTISDSSIDFNLADNFITGETAYLVMQSGQLKGDQFEIVQNSYNHSTRTFKIKQNKEGGYEYPNTTINVKIGDIYTFVGINLPQTYVDVAEAEVKVLAEQYAAEEPLLTVSYKLEPDPIHLLMYNLLGKISLGQRVRVTNPGQMIDATMRIVSLTLPLIAPELVTAEISEKVLYTEEQQILREIIETTKQTIVVKENITKVKAFTAQRLDETINMVFDPQGNYYTEKIKPRSIETLQLTVGSRSQIFALSVIFRPNTINTTYFEWTAGQLVHYTVVPNSTYTWNIPSGLVGGLNGFAAYYIYARCNKANNNATIVLDTTARQVESDSTYYYFLVGTLASSNGSSIRWITLSYGTTEINGAFIRTGSIISQDSMSVLNLDNGTYQGRIEFLNADESGYKNINTLNAEALNALTKATDAKTKTDLLKALAYKDLVQVAELGTTVITGGHINTILVDALAVRAAIIKTDYIEGLELNFVRGTIGGNEIASNGILGEKFSIIDGRVWAIDAQFEDIIVNGITAVDATVTGTFKTGTTGVRAEMNSSGVVFVDGSGQEVKLSSSIYGGALLVGTTTVNRDGVICDDGGSNYSYMDKYGFSTTGSIMVSDGGMFLSGLTVDVEVLDWSYNQRKLRYWRGVLVQVL